MGEGIPSLLSQNTSKDMNTTTTILGFDIKNSNPSILMTDIIIETPKDRKEMTVSLDMDYMGIDEDTDFDMSLSKDFMREVEIFYNEKGHLPTAGELKRLVEQYDYGCHPAPDGDLKRYFLQCEIDEVTADSNIGF